MNIIASNVHMKTKMDAGCLLPFDTSLCVLNISQMLANSIKAKLDPVPLDINIKESMDT